MPERLFGKDGDYAIRSLSQAERVQIEDVFFQRGSKLEISPGAAAVIVPQTRSSANQLAEHVTLVEFALGILTTRGFQQIKYIGLATTSSFTDVLQTTATHSTEEPVFAAAVVGTVAVKWIRHFFRAARNTPDRMHITADRFVRYLRAANTTDGLLDLCISLESLLDSQTEIQFRFGACLTKVIGQKGREAEETAGLLADLYDLRSKLAHGDPAANKLYRALAPRLPLLRKLGREILTRYVLFMSEHTPEQWKRHLHTAMFE